MLVTIVETALAIVGIYLVLGVLAAMALHAKGLHALDPATRGSGWGFRVLVTPGLVALWPILLWKWRKAGSGGEVIPDPHRPVPPRALRTIQRVSWRWMTAVALLLAAVGLVNRPPAAVDAVADGAVADGAVADGAVAGEARADLAARLPGVPAPLAEVSRELGPLFDGLPIEARLRGGPTNDGERQLEFIVARDLAIPTLALYWCPPGSRTDAAPGAGAIFLGTVWGPGERRFPLSEAVSGKGEWLLYSIARAETIAVAPGGLEGGQR